MMIKIVYMEMMSFSASPNCWGVRIIVLALSTVFPALMYTCFKQGLKVSNILLIWHRATWHTVIHVLFGLLFMSAMIHLLLWNSHYHIKYPCVFLQLISWNYGRNQMSITRRIRKIFKKFLRISVQKLDELPTTLIFCTRWPLDYLDPNIWT